MPLTQIDRIKAVQARMPGLARDASRQIFREFYMGDEVRKSLLHMICDIEQINPEEITHEMTDRYEQMLWRQMTDALVDRVNQELR